jgi:hypothetical protein
LPYNRLQAVAYAAHWWSGFNPMFRAFRTDDCTNFVSQCLLAGGMTMEVTNQREKGWWYLGPNDQWSHSWAVSHSMRWYLQSSGRGQKRAAAKELELGDVITYDFNDDEVWDHVAMVVGFDPHGEPLMAAHTIAAWGRPWRYTDSPAYTPRTKYLFWHISAP